MSTAAPERRMDNADPETPRMVRRIDRDGVSTGPLRASHVRESDGAALFEGIAAREGVLTYRGPGGSIRRELVTLDTLRSMGDGLPRGPVTLEHPPEFVSPDNVARYGVGDVDGDLVIEEDQQGAFARVKIAVRRRDALDAIAAGKHELSPGYDVTLDETPGTHPKFGPYDAIQLRRAGNHLAIVDRARGGPTVALRVDAGDAESIPSPSPGASMDPTALAALVEELKKSLVPALLEAMKAGGPKVEVEAEAPLAVPKAEFDAMKAACDEANAKLAEMQGAAAKAEEAKMDALAVQVGVKFDAADKLAAKRLKLAQKTIPGITDAADPRIPGAVAVLELGRRDSRYDGQAADPAHTDSKDSAPIDIHKAREKVRLGGGAS